MSRHNRRKPKYQESKDNEYFDDHLAQKYVLRPQSENQRKYIEAINNPDIKVVFAIGPSGSGKSHIAAISGLLGVLNGTYPNMAISRPIIGAGGESIGYEPGTAIMKLQRWLLPLYSEMGFVIDKHTLESFIEREIINVIAITHMRGLNLRSYSVVDEAQNLNFEQTKMVLTRIAKGGKLVITADFNQSDLPQNKQNKIIHYLDDLAKIDGFEVIYLEKTDIVRDKIIKDILDVLER